MTDIINLTAINRTQIQAGCKTTAFLSAFHSLPKSSAWLEYGIQTLQKLGRSVWGMHLYLPFIHVLMH